MRKYFLAKHISAGLILLSILIITFVMCFLSSQKMPLSKTTTTFFSAQNYYICDGLNNSLFITNAKTQNKNDKNYLSNYEIENQDKKGNTDKKQYATLSSKTYLIVFCCLIPLMVLIILLLVPTKKITDNLIAYDINKKPKNNNKINLGIQTKKQSYFSDDDDNL